MSNVRAFLDIGTNSVRVVVVRLAPNHTYATRVQEKETVRLGENEFVDGYLQVEAMRRAATACAGFVELATNQGAEEIVAVATSATREARNRRDFVEMLRDTANLDVRTISGREEARLIYLGVSSGMNVDDTVMFVDIGGGSTELVVGNQHEFLALDSLKLGAIRLTSLFFLPEEDGPVADDRYALLQRYAHNTMIRPMQRLQEHPFRSAVGSSGTIENLADIAARRFLGRARNRDDVLSYAQVMEIGEVLRGLPLADRRKVSGISAARADIIVAGTAILQTIMEAFDLDGLRVSDRGLREGLIIDYLSRTQPDILRETSVRERSVLGLGRACRIDEDHARTVGRLALELFDSAGEMGLHELGPRERELLEHAAMLHDTGAFLSSSGHHRHTYYLIRNADMLGFDQEEIELIAAVARFHRKGYPSKKHEEFRSLGPRSRRVVRPLAVFLRVAESLDRSRAGAVEHAMFVGPGSLDGGELDPVGGEPFGTLVAGPDDGDPSDAHAADGSNAPVVELKVLAGQEPQLELWGAASHAKAVKRTFNRELRVRWVKGPEDEARVSE